MKSYPSCWIYLCKWFYYYKPTFDFSFRNYHLERFIFVSHKDSINSDLDRFDFGIGYKNKSKQMKPMKQLLILFQKIKL